MTSNRALVAALAAAALLAACASMGPLTIARDRIDYDHAIFSLMDTAPKGQPLMTVPVS
jgi:uncharacterized lipoprotein